MRIQLTLLSLLCALSSHLLGQTFQQYTHKDGLVSNTVYYIFPDSKGFLWFGTDKGVSKYDGKSFVNYNTSNGLINDDVFIIEEDKQRRIWFGAYAPGLCYVENDSIYQYKYNDKLIEKYPDKSVKLSMRFTNDNKIMLGDDLNNLIIIDDSGKIHSIGAEKRNVFDFGDKIMTSYRPAASRVISSLRYTSTGLSRIS